MAHPAALLLGQPAEQPAAAVGQGQLGAAELARLGRLRPCRRAPAPSPASRNKSPASGCRGRAAGSGRRAPPARRPRRARRRAPAPSACAPRIFSTSACRRQQLGEHPAFADPPGDQLRVLAPEVEDQHLLGRLDLVGGQRAAGSTCSAGTTIRWSSAEAATSGSFIPALSHPRRRPPRTPRPGRSSPSRRAARSAASCPRSSAPARPSPRPAGSCGCPRSHRWPSRFSAPPSG